MKHVSDPLTDPPEPGRTYILAPTIRMAREIARSRGLSRRDVVLVSRGDQLRYHQLTASDHVVWADALAWRSADDLEDLFENLRIAQATMTADDVRRQNSGG